MKNPDFEYRKRPNRVGPAHDPAAIGSLDLENDKVSVVHSGETDPMPNREAQEAYEERPKARESREADAGEDENDYENQQEMAELAGSEEEESDIQ
jgi:hypothetical protein